MRVLISGAGIAGPTLAWHLAKAGMQVTVVEKRTRSQAQTGQNIDVNGTALRVLKEMGLFADLRRLNTTERGTHFVDRHGTPYAAFPVEGISMTSEHEILRGDLAQILMDSTMQHERIEYLFETAVQDVLANDEQAVEVQLSNGDTRRVELLVAADGQWSRTRRAVFPADAVSTNDKGAFFAYWTAPRSASDDEWWRIFTALPNRVAMVRPDPYGTLRVCLSFFPRTDAQRAEWQTASRAGPEAQQELVRRQFADAGWEVPRLLDTIKDAPDFYMQKCEQIKLRHWSVGRVVALGDAAYAPTPLTGMGAPLSILGARVLAGELSKLAPDEHPARALEAYEQVYRPFVEETQALPSFVPGIVHPQSAWRLWLLQTALSIGARIVSLSFVKSRVNRDPEVEDFKLPEYDAFPRVADASPVKA
jgi:2-polyprenyl-6-methoxyphenol hydroxylase-like FAD-dependent oxidoreductase